MASSASPETGLVTDQAKATEEADQTTDFQLKGRDEESVETENHDEPTDSSIKNNVDSAVDDPKKDADEPKFDIIGVHGLHGSEETWATTPTPDSTSRTWLDKLFSSISPEGGRFIAYNYNSDAESMEYYTSQSIYRKAHKLLEELEQHRTPEIKRAGRPIYFVCHDIGGLIVKAAIVLASLSESTYADILHSIRVIIFFGYPHRSLSSVDLEEQAFSLLSLRNRHYQRGHTMRLAKILSETINEVNGAFIHTRMLTQARVINIFSTHEDPRERVFDKFTATIGISAEYRLPSVKSHLGLVDIEELDSYTKGISPDEDWLNGNFTENFTTGLREVIHQASPIYPAINDNAVEDNPELEILTKAEYILHIQCTSHADTISETVRNYYDAKKDTETTLLYFRFKSHDIRLNTINAMLWTFCAQMVNYHPKKLDWAIEDIFKILRTGQAWEYASLFNLWERIGFRNITGNCFYVLGCLDECDNSALRFLSQIQNYITGTEGRPKIVIITTKGTVKDTLITRTLSNFPSGSISRINYNPLFPIPARIGLEMSVLLQADHRYTTNCLQDDVKAVVSGFANDEVLCRLLIKWLKSNQNPLESVSRALVNLRIPSPELLFETILMDVPEEHHLWAQKLLSWVSSSLRPLRTVEFCRVSDLCMSNNRNKNLVYTIGTNIRSRLASILPHFGGLLAVVHDEVQFSHDSIRSWLKSLMPVQGETSSTKGWYQQMTERDRHAIIVQTCLEHLRDESDTKTVWAAQLPYATQFWAAHCKEASPTENVFETIFQHQPSFERWIDAYMSLPTPFLKPLRKSHKPLPIAAHFGFENVVKSFLTTSIENDAESLGQSLIEAARAAQLPILRLIIQYYSSGLHLGDIHVQSALLAAAYSDSSELCRELVNHINVPDPHWMTSWRPKGEDKGISSGNKEGADDSLDAEQPEPLVSNNPTSTKREMELQNHDKASSWLMKVLWQTSRLGIDDVVAKLLAFGGDATSTLLQNNVEPDDSTPIHIASRNSQIGTAQLLITAGASLTADAKVGWGTPLHYAARHGSRDMINFLLEKGAPIDAKDLDGTTPLQAACQLGNFATVEPLLRFRKYQEYLTPDLQQPLHIAAANGYYKIAEALFRYEADPNMRDERGTTALSVAVRNNKIDFCRLLLAHKADPNSASENFSTPLTISIANGNLDLVKLLVENGADTNQQDTSGVDPQCTPLDLAVLENQFEISEYLLSQKADPNIPGKDGCTPLWHAAYDGSSELVRMLAKANADIHTRSSDNWAPLHVAYDHPETVRVLLEYGADINGLNNKGNTALNLAIWNNQPKVIDLMLTKSKNKPDLSLELTQAALRYAVSEGYCEVVSLLLEAGADVNLMNDNKEPLASLAMLLGDDMMVRTILEYRPDLSMKDKDGDTALHFIGAKTPATSVRLVVNAGGKLDALNDDKSTPLISAIQEQNMNAFTYLLKKKLVIDTLNIAPFKDRGTPLHIACRLGTPEMVKTLIKNGSDINFPCNSFLGTPLIAATLRTREFRGGEEEQITRLLLDEGADPTLSAGLFGYPIISASLCCSTEIVQWLLDRKVSIDVKDAFARKPAHFACYNSLKVLNMLQIPDSDFAVKDVVGRVPLHYAVLSGQLDLVEEVLVRSEHVGIDIDVRDNDGWTPLLWAARAADIWMFEEKDSSLHGGVVSFLLDKKADPNIRGSGLYKDWTASEVAYYHNADSITDLIAAKNPLKENGAKPTKRGKLYEHLHCECCHLRISGIYFTNLDLIKTGLCFKCYKSKSLIWPQHKFEERGSDWDSDDSPPETAQLEVDKPVTETDIVIEEENIDSRFDDEVLDENDVKEQEMELLQEKNN